MSKVAINKCSGWFSISKECVERIENKYGMDLSCGAYEALMNYTVNIDD